MSRKTDEKYLRTGPALVPLGDDALSAVSGAGGQGHAYGKEKDHGGGPPWLSLSPTIQQTNVTNIYQIASGNTGDVTQVAGVVQGNSGTL